MLQNFLQREARIMNLKIQESVTMMSHTQAQSLAGGGRAGPPGEARQDGCCCAGSIKSSVRPGVAKTEMKQSNLLIPVSLT